MDRSSKSYVKAINYYNEGYIDKALELCEKSISENLKNAPAINLKGLLYYLKGDIDNAQALWKMNYQVNKDVVSKKYFEDSKNDVEKDKLYKEAIKLIKEVKIKEAIEKLEACRESDFNSINVNNSIALCYTKLGEYNKAEKFIEEVFKIDKRNKTALSLRKELTEFGIIKSKPSKYYILIGIFSIIILVSAVFIKTLQKPAGYNKKAEVTESNSNTQTQGDAIKKDNNKAAGEGENKKEEPSEAFSKEEIDKALESKDYEKLYTIVSSFKGSNTLHENTELIVKAEGALKNGGVSYFYNKGREALKAKDYTSAEDNLIKAYNYGSESYLYSHITYMLGLNYKENSDIEKAIKYYKQYDSKYPSGDYEETVLYELALIYKNIDHETSKSYAKKLRKAYPKSIYNNSVTKGILER